MKASQSADGLTVRLIAGTDSIIIAIDLDKEKSVGCLGFSIHKTYLGKQGSGLPSENQRDEWLSNSLGFPQDDQNSSMLSSSETAPFQRFRISDSRIDPGSTYRYTVIARYGQPGQLTTGPTVKVQVTSEDPIDSNMAVFFNRGEASSTAYIRQFGDQPPDELPPDQQQQAKAWLSHGLEESVFAFLDLAKGSGDGLHVAMYEFQKPELLKGLRTAIDRGVDVKVVYDYRNRKLAGDKNAAAALAAELQTVCVQRKSGPQARFMHNKFVILLKNGIPQAVLTGSTNWTDTAIYDHLNLVQVFYDPALAARYEQYFQLLYQDLSAPSLKTEDARLTPVPDRLPPGTGIWPFFSPQADDKMLALYASICRQATTLFVCSSFDLAPQIQQALVANDQPGSLQFTLIGSKGGLRVGRISLDEKLDEYLVDNSLIKAHSLTLFNASILAADLLGSDPVLVVGSSRFSADFATLHDENSVVIRGNTALADCYLTEFMRLYDHYFFIVTKNQLKGTLQLAPDDRWTMPYYEIMSRRALERHLFAGTDLSLPTFQPLSSLEDMPRSSSASKILQVSRILASGSGRAVPLPSGFLFYSLMSYGNQPDTSRLAAWFEQKIVKSPAYQSERIDFFKRTNTNGIEPDWQGVETPDAELKLPTSITPTYLQIFQRAFSLARQTGAKEILAQHLLIALLGKGLLTESDSAELQIQRSGLDLPILRRELFLFLRYQEGELAKQSEEWLLGPNQELEEPSGYDADSPAGVDLLNIKREVNAFARLMAARTVQPPLSIGLFGEWGSGKTFFMREMRKAVAKLADDAQKSDKMQQHLPFYKRIVQIEFNAWHYVEGNLWASLMQHIFEELKVQGDKKTTTDKLRQHLLTELGYKKLAQAQARKEVKQAKNKEQQVYTELAKTKQELHDKASELASLYSQRDLQNYFFEPLKEDINNLVKTLGLSIGDEEQKNMKATLMEARSVLEGGRAIWAPLSRANDKKRRWRVLILSLVAVPVAAWIMGIIPALLGKQALSQITALAGGVGTFFVTGATWLRNQLSWVSERLKEVKKIQQKYDQEVKVELTDLTDRIKSLEEEHDQLRIKLSATLNRKIDAEKQVAEAQVRLDRATVTNLLADFIRDRADSNDYRKYLGLLALVRQDFEKLSDLMEEQNFYLAPPGPLDGQADYPAKNKYQTLDEERENETNRFNRIILYIDDLDRCPPHQVVDVLQAVHLLLAFPLFVVVVGVDARWVTRSLITQHRQLLREYHTGTEKNDFLPEEAPPSLDVEGEIIYGGATPRDYLEKIFQIPYWLKPMDVSATKEMIDGLLVEPASTFQPDVTGAPQKDQPEQPDEKSPERGVLSPGGSEPPQGGRELLQGGGLSETALDNGSAGRIKTPSANLPTMDQQAPKEEESLGELMQITEKERQFMKDLAPLLGHSPRSLKRFINVYRLIKARQTRNELSAFLTESETLPDYQAVLFLLAIDVGLPGIASVIYEKINQHIENQVSDLYKLIDSLDRDEKTSGNQNWIQLKRWLEVDIKEGDVSQDSSTQPNPRPYKLRLPPDLAPLAIWVSVVSRYSFQFSTTMD